MGLFDSVVGGVKSSISNGWSNIKGSANPTDPFRPIRDPSGWADSNTQVLTDPGNLFSSTAPKSPGTNPDIDRLKEQQQAYAKQFRTELPQIQQSMGQSLVKDANKNLQGNLSNVRSSNSARGLLYGGINAGQEGQARVQAQRGLMKGLSGMNLGLQNAANQMDKSAIQTGVSMQQQQQALQNMIYQNAMAAQAGQNQMAGSALSAGAMMMMA